jgi:hypothetical protein
MVNLRDLCLRQASLEQLLDNVKDWFTVYHLFAPSHRIRPAARPKLECRLSQ